MGWCWYLKIALGTCKQEAPSQEGGRSLAESIRAPQYLTPHFLTNVTELLRAPSFSFRGCLWSSFFFFPTLHSKPVIFFVYALKETDGENHRGEKPTKYSLPRRDHPIHIGSQMARRGDPGVHLVRRGWSIA